MPFQRVTTRPFLVATVLVAMFFIIWNVALSTLQGWSLYYRVSFNLTVIASLLLGFRHAKLLVRVWAAIPLVSLGLFLLSSVLKGEWSAQPMEHIIAVALTLPLLIWSNKAFARQPATISTKKY